MSHEKEEHMDNGSGSSVKSGAAGTTSDKEFDPVLVRKAVLRQDLTVVPVVTMLYLLSFLDNTNFGNARVAGLQKDLKMTDDQYSIALTVFWVPFILAELPGGLILKKIGPRILLPSICVGWGLVATFQGFVTSYAGLLAARVFLGLVEGFMLPCIVVHLSTVYTRSELQFRYALFVATVALAGAFSGLLAAAIIQLDGKGGKAGWAWIFILEGLFTVAFGFISFFLISNTPRENRLLTPDQQELIMARLARDRPTANDKDGRFSWFQVFASLKSVHVILNCCSLVFAGVLILGLVYFIPTILFSLGYSATRTQLFAVAPFAVAFPVNVISSYLSDRYAARGITSMGLGLLALMGLIIFHTQETTAARYGSLFLTVPGAISTSAPLCTWMANNSEPHYRRATSIALGFIASGFGSIVSLWIFPTKEAPGYKTGTVLGMVSCVGIIVLSAANIAFLKSANAKKQRNREQILAPYRGREDGDAAAWRELGDRHPDFKYIY